MLTVTEAAKVLLAELIELRGFSGEIAIRLFNGDRGLAIVGDSERVGGVTFQHEGRTVLHRRFQRTANPSLTRTLEVKVAQDNESLRARS